jgi:hypothetical protein
VVAVDIVERRGKSGEQVLQVVVRQVTATQDQVNLAEPGTYCRRIELFGDLIADGKDSHAHARSPVGGQYGSDRIDVIGFAAEMLQHKVARAGGCLTGL